MLFRRVLAARLKRLKSSAVSASSALAFEDVPSPRGLPIVGTTLALVAQGSAQQLHKYIDNRHKQLGPVFKEKLGPVSCLFISDPEVIRDVYNHEGKYPMHVIPEPWIVYNRKFGCPRGLFFMDGPKWWHHRRIANNLLLKGDLHWIQQACDVVSDNFIRSLGSAGDKCYEDLKGALYKWSLDIIVATLLGAETYEKHYKELEEQVIKLSQIVHSVFETTAKLSLIPSTLASKLKIPPWNRFVDSVDHALDGANSLVTTLKTLNPPDVGLLPKLTKENIDPQEIRRIIVDLILAAGDTTAITMEWMLYLLGKIPEVQQQLRTNPEMARYVLRETLRLYPIATFLTRILPEDAILGGYSIPKNTLVVMSMYTSGRNEKYFENPDCFQPERWDRKRQDYNPEMQKASLPFAIGLRTCVGRKIAETQLHTMILKIVDNFHIELCNERDIEIVMKMVVYPSEPLQIKFKKL